MKYTIKEDINIKCILKDAGIKTQKELAEKVGIRADYISQILNGKHTTKRTAYAITKSISPDLEIENIFNKF